MPLAPTADTRWQTRDFDKLVHETWDTETFVSNPNSGNTHVLNEAAFALLKSLASTPSRDVDLAQDFDAVSAELRAALLQQLQQLELVGLICRTR